MLVNVFAKEDIKMKNIETINSVSFKVGDMLYELNNNLFHEIKEIDMLKRIYYDGEMISAIEKIRIFTGNSFSIEEFNEKIIGRCL